MRARPIGTGPFKFVEFKPNEVIRVTRNPDYWKQDRPYLDGIEWTIIKNVSTGVLAFVAGKVDLTSPYLLQIPVLRDVKSQAPEAICEVVPLNANRNVIINRDAPPFNDPDLRRAMALSLDRMALIDILTEGQGNVGGVMQPPPEGIWSMPPDMLKALPGYDPDLQKNRAEARKIIAKLGYGAANRLKITVSARNTPQYRDPAVILIDQLKEVYIDGELEPIDTVQWYPKVMRKDYTVGLSLTANGLDDPDQTLYENFACGAEGNYDGYCNPEVDQLIDQQSMQFAQEQRKELVWAIERKLAEDVARPILYHIRAGTCWQPYVKGFNLMVNSAANGARMEDVWLDK
jgi:peptide/nickel transport system substrate-binding protein